MRAKHTTYALLAGLSLFSVFNSPFAAAFAQGTAFTYQGRLTENGAPPSGAYDLQFSLCKNSDGGGLVAGPVAQDFRAAFGLGDSETAISTVDADGVALAAIQDLNQKVDSENAGLRSENAELKRELSQIKQLLLQLSKKRTGP